MIGNAQQKKRERPPRSKPKETLPICFKEVFKIAFLHPLNRRDRPTWEIIREAPGKAVTDDFLVHFQPLFPHFFERVDW